ncbi:MAG: hypothetical protein N2319_04580 [Candidatus Kapabacteria bacterium]|nr:hypothetical protein [Candidatus Kapabacteria bacterium]
MKSTKKKVIVILIFILTISLFFSCSEKSSPINYLIDGKTALVIVVENNDGLLSTANDPVYQFYKYQLLSIFSELFQVPLSEINNLTINEIIETYGEDWQINEIKKHAVGIYDTIIALQDEAANLINLQNILINLNQVKYNIDMVFCLHGTSEIFVLNNSDYCDIQQFANFIRNNKINLRMLYQTCCDAGQALNKWASSGIYAVNGAVSTNHITLFSPGFFMEEWVNGATFEQAVKNAFNRDIEKIGSYNDRVPVKTYLLTESNIKNSVSLFGGKDKNIRFSNKIVIYP